ncbi:DNA-binding transcriptional regulator, AcrR family [Thermomonospora echinospora]|uniref:DNA-binding transcriptional regulator, AcrR family n=1 Tax=Thermomonospora echinospora TaxID=1992 RepID=A0A1H6D8S0_9ACTN|nr:TetR/AcrR family transcriptional regulator C-terminal domain-containing protein [Thermomonospora echinospora]SEG80876.1 DNA-binding transcriptional regulator, AcrR family [Thermomonospora echinospora]
MAEQTQGGTLPAAGREADVRPPLTYDRIIRTAIALIEREGVAALSMRRVGGELGVAAMSLYNHVPSKEAMLDGVAEEILSGLRLDAGPQAGWRDRIRDLAHAFRRTAQEHPRSMSVVLSRSMDWTRSLPVLEQMLTIAEQAGFQGETAVRVMRTFMAYVMGTLMREASTADALWHIAQDGVRAAEMVDPAAFPHVVATARELLDPDFDADFDFGLELLITAIERLPRTAG